MVNGLNSYDSYEQDTKQIIYWDVDDVILNSGETIVELLNQKRQELGLQPRELKDLKDWGYKSILRDTNKNEIEALFESDDFWNRVKIKSEFIELMKSGILNSYNHRIVTKGSSINRKKKFKKLSEDLNELNWEYFIGIENNRDKSVVDMTGGILIDDNYDNLVKTNAQIKILLKNGLTTDYNTNYGKYGNIDNLYIVETLEEVRQILEFNLEFSL